MRPCSSEEGLLERLVVPPPRLELTPLRALEQTLSPGADALLVQDARVEDGLLVAVAAPSMVGTCGCGISVSWVGLGRIDAGGRLTLWMIAIALPRLELLKLHLELLLELPRLKALKPFVRAIRPTNTQKARCEGLRQLWDWLCS